MSVRDTGTGYKPDPLDIPPDDWGGDSSPRVGDAGSDLERGYIDGGSLNAEVGSGRSFDKDRIPMGEKDHLAWLNNHGKT